MKKRKKNSAAVVGGSSLLVIFSVLCLTVFALLSVSTVKSDSDLNARALAGISGYYEADCRAQEILGELRRGSVPAGVTVRGGVYTYECPISDSAHLAVEVEVDGSEYTVLRWQSVSDVAWEADEHLSVWDGE